MRVPGAHRAGEERLGAFGLAVDPAPELDAVLGSEERLVSADDASAPGCSVAAGRRDHVVLLVMGDATLVLERRRQYRIAAGDQSAT
jgi:hypothetical protein